MKHFDLKRKMRKNKSSRKLKLSTALFKGGYVHNTILTQLTGICPIAAAATDFKNAFFLSIAFTMLIIVCETVASALFKGISRWIRVCLYSLVSVICLIPVFSWINEQNITALGVYLSLLCVNGIIVIRCEKFSVRTTVRNSLFDALATAAGFSVVALIVGIIREFIVYGTAFGIKSGNPPKISAMAMPFGGLIILGFLAAIQKWSVKKFFPDEITDTFSFSGAFEAPAIKDPGLNSKAEREKAKARAEEIREYDKIKPRYSIEDIESSLESKEDKHE